MTIQTELRKHIVTANRVLTQIAEGYTTQEAISSFHDSVDEIKRMGRCDLAISYRNSFHLVFGE